MSLTSLITAVRKTFPQSRNEEAYADLMALDDYLLADIGLRRSGIVAAVCGQTHATETPPAPRQCRPVEDGYFPLF